MADDIGKNKRYAWIDNVKLICIFFIIYFHAGLNIDISYVIALFFFISGFLYKDKYLNFISFLKHRSRQLLIPYFCFFLIFYVYWLLVGREGSSLEEQELPLYYPLLEYLYGRPHYICCPLWFISCLFLMQNIFFILNRLIKKRYYISIILLLLPSLPFIVDLSNTPFMLEAVCVDIPFYGIAFLYKTEILALLERKKWRLPVIGLLFIGFILTFYFRTFIQDALLKEYLFLLGAFSSSMLVFFLIKNIDFPQVFEKFSNYLASNAIVILAFHTYSIIILYGIYSRFFGWELGVVGKEILTFIVALVSLVSMIIPIYLFNRYTPWILGKKKQIAKD